jgi:hypothetical protein
MSAIIEVILQSAFTSTSQLVWGLAFGTILAIPEYARDRFLVSHPSIQTQRIETIIVTSSVAPNTNSTLTITEPASTSTVTKTTTSAVLGETTSALLPLNTTTIKVQDVSTYWSTSISTVTEQSNQTSTVFEPVKPTDAVSDGSRGLYEGAPELTEDAKLVYTLLLFSSLFANGFLLYRVLKFRHGTYKKNVDARKKELEKLEAVANAKAAYSESKREDAIKALTEERKNAAKASTVAFEARKKDMATTALQDKIVRNLLETINEMELRETDMERFELDDFRNDTAMEASLNKWRALRDRNITLMQNSAAEAWHKLSNEKTEEVDTLVPRVQNLTEKFREFREENGFPST